MSSELLVLRAGDRLCALAVTHVEETMRPLPLEALPDVPAFVRGVSIIRGAPTPVVDLRALLGEDAARDPARLVTLSLPRSRRVAVLVDGVLGLRDDAELAGAGLPPLLEDAAAEIVAELARLDDDLLTILRAGKLLPEDVWTRAIDREDGR